MPSQRRVEGFPRTPLNIFVYLMGSYLHDLLSQASNHPCRSAFGKCSPSPLSSTSPTLSSIRMNHGVQLAKHPGELTPLRRCGSGETTSALCAAAISVPHNVHTYEPLSKTLCNPLVNISDRHLGKIYVALVLIGSLLRSGTSTVTQHKSISQHEERPHTGRRSSTIILDF